MDIEVRGRTTADPSDLRSKVTIGPNGVVIRVDDDLNPAAWIEIELSLEQLCDLSQESSFLMMERDWPKRAETMLNRSSLKIAVVPETPNPQPTP